MSTKSDCFALSCNGTCKVLSVTKCDNCSFYRNKADVDLLKIEQDIIRYSCCKSSGD